MRRLQTCLLTAAGMCAIGALALHGPVHADPHSPTRGPEIDRFIRSMQFDPRELLTARQDGALETLPARRRGQGNVIICRNTEVNDRNDVDDLTILAPTGGTVFPGGLVRVNRSLAEGRPQAIALPRGSVTFRLELPGANNVVTVPEANFAKVQDAVEAGVSRWLVAAAKKGLVSQARSTFRVESATTREHLAMKLGVDARWLDIQFSSNLSGQSSRNETTQFAVYRQIYYTATANPPTAPSEVFAPSVSLGTLQQVVDSDNPPGMVRSVHYGRVILIRMDMKASEQSGDLEGILNYVSGPTTEVNATTRNHYDQMARNARFAVMVFGGDARDGATLQRADNLSQLEEVIRRGAALNAANRGLPIAYSVSFLRDEEVARVAFTTRFVQSQCTTHPDAFVRLRHDGAFVARFRISWKERNDEGAMVAKTWESGNRTAGWTHAQHFPGDAEQISIRAEAASGLAWDPWPEAMQLRLASAANQCFRIFGTTLNRRHERFYGGDCAN